MGIGHMTATCLLMDMSNDGMNLDLAIGAHLPFSKMKCISLNNKRTLKHEAWTGFELRK